MTKFFTRAGRAIACAVLAAASIAWADDGAPVPPQPATTMPATPGAQCELRFGSWCILTGAIILQRKHAPDDPLDRQWTLTYQWEPRQTVIVQEPRGCQQGVADRLELLRLERNVKRDYRFWDKATVRLKQDGKCDLAIWMPPVTADMKQVASATGLTFVKSCEDDACSGKSLGDRLFAAPVISAPRKRVDAVPAAPVTVRPLRPAQ